MLKRAANTGWHPAAKSCIKLPQGRLLQPCCAPREAKLSTDIDVRDGVSTSTVGQVTTAPMPAADPLVLAAKQSLHSHAAPGAGQRQGGTACEPRQITAAITACATLAELQAVVHAHGEHMNAINTAAALVKLSKMGRMQRAADLHDDLPSGTSPVGSNGHSKSSGLHELQHMAGVHERTHTHAMASTSGQAHTGRAWRGSNGNSSAAQLGQVTAAHVNTKHHTHGAPHLAAKLATKFAQQLGQCGGARQVANVCWALGHLAVQAPTAAVSRMSQHLLSGNAIRLRQASPQELANLAWGLARLEHTQPELWEAICEAAQASAHGGKEAFKSQELANLAWAAATVMRQLNTSPQMQQAADAGGHAALAGLHHALRQLVQQLASEAAHSRKPFLIKEVVSLMWSCAATGCAADTSEVQQLVAWAVPQLRRAASNGALRPQDVGNSAWALAKLHQQAAGHQLLDAICSMLTMQLSHNEPVNRLQAADNAAHQPGGTGFPVSYTSQELSNLLWACATLGYEPPSSVTSTLCMQLAWQAAALEPQVIANATWAAAKLGQHSAPFMASMLHAGAAQAQALNPQELSNLLWALATSHNNCWDQPYHAADLAVLLHTAQRRMSLMQPQALTQLAWVAGCLSRAPAAHVPGSMQPVGSGEASGSAFNDESGRAGSPGSVVLYYQHLAEAVSQQALARISHFKPQELTVLAHGLSCALRDSAEPSLFQAIAAEATKHIAAGGFSPGGLTSLVAAFARVQQRSQPLACAVVRAAGARLDALEPHQVANLLWALTSLRVRDKALLARMSTTLLQGPLSKIPDLRTATPNSSNATTAAAAAATSAGGANAAQPASQLPPALDPVSRMYDSMDSAQSESDMDEQALDLDAAAQEDIAASAASGARTPGMTWAVLTWAFARSGYHQPQLYDRLAMAVLQDSSNSPPGTPQQQPSAAQPSNQLLLAHMSTPCLVQLVWAFATHDHPHPPLFRAMAPTLALRVVRGQLSAREVACVAWGYAKLQHHAPVLFQAILNHALAHTQQYNLRTWSRLAWAFSTLCLPSEEAFFMRLHQLQREHAAVVAAGHAGKHGSSSSAARGSRSPRRPAQAVRSSTPAGALPAAAAASPAGAAGKANVSGSRSKGVDEQEWWGGPARDSLDELQRVDVPLTTTSRPAASIRRELRRPVKPQQQQTPAAVTMVLGDQGVELGGTQANGAVEPQHTASASGAQALGVLVCSDSSHLVHAGANGHTAGGVHTHGAGLPATGALHVSSMTAPMHARTLWAAWSEAAPGAEQEQAITQAVRVVVE